MIYTIVPARNEGEKISKTLDMLLRTNSDRILVVINGCTDDTLKRVSNINSDRIQILYFNTPLGLDVPRSIGALSAYKSGATGFIFVDGDMIGNISDNINEIIFDIATNNIDMALTDCYTGTFTGSNTAKILLSFRRQLNLELGIYDNIAYAVPSHGPHGISKRFIDKIGVRSLSIPPVSLALAVKNSLNIKVSTRIPNHVLRSTTKDSLHASRIAQTIIGDCIEACLIYQDNRPQRGFDGMEFLGYHRGRRFDILDLILETSD